MLITNSNEFRFKKIQDLHKVKNSADLPMTCASLGMLVGSIKTIEDLKTVFMLALEYQHTVHNDEGVLIG